MRSLRSRPSTDGVHVSAKTGAGLDELRRKLLEVAGWQGRAGGVYIARERHVQALRRVDAHLAQATGHMAAQRSRWICWPRNCASRRRTSTRSPAEFTSTTCWALFSRAFCIGK